MRTVRKERVNSQYYQQQKEYSRTSSNINKIISDKLDLTNRKIYRGNAAKILSSLLGQPALQQKTPSQTKIVVRNISGSKNISTSQPKRTESLRHIPRPEQNTYRLRIKQDITQKYHSESATPPPGSHYDFLRRFKIDQSRISRKSMDTIVAFGANTHYGLIRNYNEDRVSIVINMGPKKNCHFFAVYDGHGGSACVEYLKDSLHGLLSQSMASYDDMKSALYKAIAYAEKRVLQDSYENQDFSGSCVLVCAIIDEIAYIANVGDCRAIVAYGHGQEVKQLTIDHKPDNQQEQERIVKAGGTVYQNRAVLYGSANPCRVIPGRLSVSRTIGDLYAKDEKYGGKKHVVIAEPEHFEYKVNQYTDFLLLASDGIYDRLTNQDIARIVYNVARSRTNYDIHLTVGKCIEALLIEAFKRQATDNLSIVMMAFYGLESVFQKASPSLNFISRNKSTSPVRKTPIKYESSNLASYRRLQLVKEVLRRNVSSKK